MTKSLIALLLFALTIPAFAAPFALRSEVPVSEPVYGAVREISRSGVRMATDGNEYLAVWTDSREGGEPSLYAARLRADGTVVDPLGIRIANNAHAGPVVWTGSKYLIAFEQGYGYQAYVRTMTPDGVFGEPIEVGRYASFASMATNGTNVLLVLSDEAMLLDLEGRKLKSVPLAPGHYSYARVAEAGGTYLVAAPLQGVTVQTVSSDGAVGAVQQLSAPLDFTRVDVASDGERFFVTWADHQIKAQFVTRAGVPEGPVRTLAYKANSNWPRASWVDGEYLVVFSETNEPAHYAVRVAADGTVADPTHPKRLGRDIEAEVEIVARGRSGIAMFRGLRAALFDDASLEEDTLFRRVVEVGITARPQTNVHLARLGDGYVAAWEEDDRIFLSTAAGTTPVAVVGSDSKLVDVLVDQSHVIWVIWASETDFHLTRFWPSLEAIDAQPVWIDAPGAPYVSTAAAANGVIALAYEVSDPQADVRDLAALLLWETGSGLARRDVLLTTESFADFSPAVAFDGTAFVYGWFHAKGEEPPYLQPSPPTELVAARVSLDGDLLDATPVRLADDAGTTWQIDAARGANGVAFAWQAGGGKTRLTLFGGSSVVELEGAGRTLGELTPHDGGFLLVRGISRRTPALTEVEYLLLGANLSVAATGTLPPYEADNYWKDFDIDVIGGASPVFAYAKSANDAKYGHVPRVFVRRTGEAPPRRRALR
ncbi:MAG TPA: hypothetical protein VF432_26415 [Thermoanaerobaculia bacterium]